MQKNESEFLEKQWSESYQFLIKRNNMWKKIFFTLLSISFFLFSHQVWAQCEYVTEIQQCHKANQDNTTREIKDFICLAKKGNPEYYSYQIILDKKFQEIDEKIEKFLTDLGENKGYYFWPEKQENFIEWINNISNLFAKDWDFWSQYMQVCTDLNSDIFSCKTDAQLKDIYPQNNGSVSISNALEFYPQAASNCSQLAEQKLEIYKQVAYDTLYVNKTAIAEDNKKLYQQKQRSAYDKLLSKFMINLWYVERIWAKWPAKTKHTSG